MYASSILNPHMYCALFLKTELIFSTYFLQDSLSILGKIIENSSPPNLEIIASEGNDFFIIDKAFFKTISPNSFPI